MFESAEMHHEVSKERFAREVPALRTKLLDAQYRLLESKAASIVVVVGGVDGAGKGETVNLLNGWLDPRHVATYGFGGPSDEERDRPPFWRFWRVIPPKGRSAIFFGSWYTEPIVSRVLRHIGKGEADRAMERIRHFEEMLSNEGVVLVKLWFHLSKEDQGKRLRALEKDPRTRWRVTKTDWAHFRLYDRFRAISSRALRQTSSEYAPWQVVAGGEPHYRSLMVGRAVLGAFELAAKGGRPPERAKAAPAVDPVDQQHVLHALDLKKSLDKNRYEKDLEKLQGRLNVLTRRPQFHERSLVVVFEGADAAGKGSAIRRLTAALDARIYQVVPVAAPTDEERARPYLWRFWRQLPARGKVLLFDRSWYGRVLVERVEGFCTEADWARAYSEINEFEEQLAEHGVVLVKLWLQIDAAEQLRRFRDRQKTGFKRYKLGPEDWRNRKKTPAYERAVADMIDRTSTEIAPWTLVEANDKRWARAKILQTICERLKG